MNRAWLGLLSVGMAAACGGTAIVDPGGEGAGAAAGTGGTGGTGATAGTGGTGGTGAVAGTGGTGATAGTGGVAGTGGTGATGGTGGCGGGLVYCDDECINPLFNMEHCGASGNCQGQNAGDVCDPQTETCAMGTCECQAQYVECANQCIDPDTDHRFCGASGNCQGQNAGEHCSPTEACTNGQCIDSCLNCGFELGDFTHWDALDLSSPFFPLSVGQAGAEAWMDFFLSDPTEGQWAALNGFDGDGPGTIEIGQDITLAPVSSATLRFDYRAAWDLATYGATEDRTFSVQIEPPGGGPPMQTELILAAVVGTIENDTGVQTPAIDVSAYTGQQIYVRFVWWVPETYTGPAFFQLDDVRVTSP